MWIAKIFGGRKARIDRIEGEEPARFPVDHAADITMSRIDRERVAGSLQGRPTPTPQKLAGFDPYNSGTFKKESAWERVTRK